MGQKILPTSTKPESGSARCRRFKNHGLGEAKVAVDVILKI
jgi:hypothetical protein